MLVGDVRNVPDSLWAHFLTTLFVQNQNCLTRGAY
jgi:hypothetical protein